MNSFSLVCIARFYQQFQAKNEKQTPIVRLWDQRWFVQLHYIGQNGRGSPSHMRENAQKLKKKAHMICLSAESMWKQSNCITDCAHAHSRKLHQFPISFENIWKKIYIYIFYLLFLFKKNIFANFVKISILKWNL